MKACTNDMSETIVLCEPQCWGFEHATFNAALLKTILVAYPGAQVILLGEREHLKWVCGELDREPDTDNERILWQDITIPGVYLGSWKDLGKELVWCRALLNAASTRAARFLTVCSITNTGLLALKLLMHARREQRPVLVVPHSILTSIATRQPRRPWKWLIGFRQVMTFLHPRLLRYVALGGSIYQALAQVSPNLTSHFTVLDQPYLWSDLDTSFEIHRTGVIRFGYFGSSDRTKGFDRFFRLASETQQQAHNCEFVMVGFVYTESDYLKSRQAIQGVTQSPLSREEYARRAAGITYAVGTSNPEHYRLAASASFLDALAHSKPGIYLRNSYIEYYFEQMGDIGYLCDTHEQMKNLILSIAKDFPAERYLHQCETIRHGRRIFEPQVLASKLRGIVESLEGE